MHFLSQQQLLGGTGKIYLQGFDNRQQTAPLKHDIL